MYRVPAAQGLHIQERERLVALKELEGWDLSYMRDAVSSVHSFTPWRGRGEGLGNLPLTILQKIQVAILLAIDRFRY